MRDAGELISLTDTTRCPALLYIYFDRVASDPSGLKFEEWQPERVFSADDVGEELTIYARGHVKVGRAVRHEVFWGAASFSYTECTTLVAAPKRPRRAWP